MTESNERTVRLLGEEAFGRLQDSLVAVVGLGGVGGHCVEALARAGVGRLHIVDSDEVVVSNLNRQLIATKRTLGMKKTEAMWKRIVDVSDCIVTASDVFVREETVAEAVPADADFIVDAVDSLAGKLALVVYAREKGIPIVSCMGAGNRLDPSRFHIADIYETTTCPLARRMRQSLKKLDVKSLPVVVSDEPPLPVQDASAVGSLAPVTAAAGLCLAGYVIRRLAGLQ